MTQTLACMDATVDDTLAERDLVPVHRTSCGLPMNARAVLVTGTTFFRMADGCIAEGMDALRLARADEVVGMLPAPATGSATRGNPASGTAR